MSDTRAAVRHVGVAADDRADLVVPGSRVAEEDLAQASDRQRQGCRERGQEVDLVGAEGGRRVGGDRVGDLVAFASAVLDRFAVRVARAPQDAVGLSTQQVYCFGRLRARRDVAGEDDAVGGGHLRFGEDRLQGRQDSVDVGQDGHPGSSSVTCPHPPVLPPVPPPGASPPHPRQLLQLRTAREAVRQNHRVLRGLPHRRQQLFLRAGRRHLVMPLLEAEVARQPAAAARQFARQAAASRRRRSGCRPGPRVGGSGSGRPQGGRCGRDPVGGQAFQGLGEGEDGGGEAGRPGSSGSSSGGPCGGPPRSSVPGRRWAHPPYPEARSPRPASGASPHARGPVGPWRRRSARSTPASPPSPEARPAPPPPAPAPPQARPSARGVP